VKVKVKRLSKDAVIPKYAKTGDAGMDITAIHCEQLVTAQGLTQYVYSTGLAFEIPEGYYMQAHARSSIYKTGYVLSNSVGIVDSGYRGEVKFIFNSCGGTSHARQPYEVGDRIGQVVILPYPQVEFEEVEELSDTERGTSGFGSTGL